jgi:hypothetical protein
MNKKPPTTPIGIQDAYEVMEKIKREAKTKQGEPQPGKATPPPLKPGTDTSNKP